MSNYCKPKEKSMSNWQSTCEKCGERYYDSDGHDCKRGDCNLCKHARDDLKCQISIDGGLCNNYDKWEPKDIKCKGCISDNGTNPPTCRVCNNYDLYEKEKSMEKNEKFEEWIEGNTVAVKMLQKAEQVEKVKEYLQDAFEAGDKTHENTEVVMCGDCHTYHSGENNFCPECGRREVPEPYKGQFIPRSPDKSKTLGELWDEASGEPIPQGVKFQVKDDLTPLLDHQTPNCATCKWAGGVIIGTTPVSICIAQADAFRPDVYNNDQCQALYEVEEVK